MSGSATSSSPTPLGESPTGAGADPLPVAARALAMMPSAIRKVANAYMEDPAITALWFGEGCWPSPEVAVRAAQDALAEGDHFYAPNAGKRSLRDAISAYYRNVYGLGIAERRVLVTGSGMLALALAAQSLITPGDRVVVVEPVWPNIAETFRFAGANLVRVGLTCDRDGVWSLDLDCLLDALTPATRAVVINSPNNPSGWCADAEQLDALLAHCRRAGIWMVSDDVYARLYYQADFAPSLIERATPEDRLISVNSCSKAWSMTGWRVGWMIVPDNFRDTYEQMTEYFNSCVANFAQVGAAAALAEGEPYVADLKKKLATGRALTTERLQAMPRVRFAQPDGAFYAFFAVDGLRDSAAAATALVEHARVGIAPGVAFGESGEGYLRMCYAREPETLETALDSIARYLES